MSVNPGSLTDSSKITLQIGNEKLAGFSGLQVSLGIDTASNAFSFSVPWKPTEENKARFKPFRAQIVKIRIDDQLILTGYIESTAWNLAEADNQVTIQGRSASGTLVDWSAGPPFQFQNVTFNQFSTKLYQAFDPSATVGVIYATPDTSPISEISIEPGETVYDISSKIGSAAGLWAVPDEFGRLEYKKISSKSVSFAVLEEGKGPVRRVSASAELIKRFQRYMVVGTFDGKDATAEVFDPETFGLAKRGRLITPLSQQTTDINQAAIFSRSKALIESYTASCEVQGWHYNGNLWKPGNIITLKAPGAYINYPSRFMIRNVTLQLDENAGQIAGLELSIPEAWDGTQPEVLPWRE